MPEKNSKHFARKGANEKRGITVTPEESMIGELLPMQLVYKGKANRSLPAVRFPVGFVLTYNEKHWSNEKESLNLIQKIICPYLNNVKKSWGFMFYKKFYFCGMHLKHRQHI